MRHHARFRSLCSENKQKDDQAKYEQTTVDADVNEIIKEVHEKRKPDSTHTTSLRVTMSAIKKNERKAQRK